MLKVRGQKQLRQNDGTTKIGIFQGSLRSLRQQTRTLDIPKQNGVRTPRHLLTGHHIDSCNNRTSALYSIDRWYLCFDIVVEKLILSLLAAESKGWFTIVRKMSSVWHNKCFMISLLWTSSSGINLLLSS